MKTHVKQTTLRRLISLVMLAILVALFGVLGGGSFLTPGNFSEILRDASVVGIIGVGVTYVIITAGIDLSTGSMMALVGMTMANVYAYTALPIWLMIVIGMVVGLIAGLINGLIVARLNVPEFIGTLATMGVFRAVTYLIAIKDAHGVIQSQPLTVPEYTVLGASVGPLFVVTIVMALFIAAGQVVLKYTRFGTRLYAVGANRKAATLSGIDVARTRVIAYVIVGLCVSVGAIFTTARLQSTTALLGSGFEFDPIAAAVVGGVSLAGGSGDIVGTLIGAVFMATLENGVLKLHMNTAYQYIIKGVVIVLVVMLDALYKSRLERASRERGAQGGAEA
ncbi:ABC transporter permease [Olsenella sp. HMSC062G07]|uniref:ABC transporter permease n=1 Tax=Olsenella sp. HMSC062G07 TaxID=1739330 RepID=UPI0008A1FDE7|nr:ABC transporter permease [Olsenella sp. HMSC062G07]OFK23438.1 ribonucleotide-diphosphate reductase subunit alpha [Olsenella sp. HMSC062G07]